jgi:hypothetical protein
MGGFNADIGVRCIVPGVLVGTKDSHRTERIVNQTNNDIDDFMMIGRGRGLLLYSWYFAFLQKYAISVFLERTNGANQNM